MFAAVSGVQKCLSGAQQPGFIFQTKTDLSW